ncbi:universal stress protein [Streptomyces sp. NPDC048507]|uniref:universal stress protein n=1 Tax=Streptomyces sp. NPDC048507 TaxID=3365560 RepID=UPI003720A775
MRTLWMYQPLGMVNGMDRQHEVPRIVVGVDGSPSSQAALRWATRYAGLVSGRVEAVAAWDLPGAASWSAPAVDTTFDEEEAERRLVEEVRAVLGEDVASSVHQRLVRTFPSISYAACGSAGRRPSTSTCCGTS